MTASIETAGTRTGIVAGSASLAPLVQHVNRAFHARHPEWSFTPSLAGAAQGLASLIHGSAALSLQRREISDEESVPYFKGVGHRPRGVRVALAGPEAPDDEVGAVALFVHADNPLVSLDLVQAARVFTEGHADGDCVTWGQLNVRDAAWQSRVIRPLLREEGSALGTHLRRHALGGRGWTAGCGQFDATREMLAALAGEPSGIAFAPLGVAGNVPGIRPLALAMESSAPPVACSGATIADGSYPLAGGITLYVRPNERGGLTPQAWAYAEFLLSKEGQQAIAQAGSGYLPLDPASLHAARTALLSLIEEKA
ncbi:Phosphate ABC transporter, periplasmic phosphate-binding protein PstS (TC 3.A.1.7.1) [plant metagenome]|uniref:Phosphate ABC transporter, periplasmic phosphate-binding protein PstS (TC 3.A.1.7.1) n=1 Tax=plant metagenome TaxID=1297885 RepID=A0A484UUB2_9ZZZZ